MKTIQILHRIKELGYKFVYAPCMVHGSFYTTIEYTEHNPCPVNPLQKTNTDILLYNKYLYLIQYAKKLQHYPTPLKLYTRIYEGNTIQISGICISKHSCPLVHITQLLNAFGQTHKENYTTHVHKYKKLVRVYSIEDMELEVGMWDNLSNVTTKTLGYRWMVDITYFKITIKR